MESCSMKVVLTTPGKHHTFDLARQLHLRGMLRAIYTGYPRFKLRQEDLPQSLIHSLPWIGLSYQAFIRVTTDQHLVGGFGWLTDNTEDLYVSAVIPPCDIFMALGATGLHTGRKIQRRGGIYICDRPCSHIRYQDAILREEYERHGLRFAGVDPRAIAKEEAEYAAADAVTVPSTFVKRSFLEMGFPEAKLHCVPYGVDLSRFYPVDKPEADEFNVLFAGAAAIRKGVGYLLTAFAALQHPRKRLTFVGGIFPEAKTLIDQAAATLPITCLGHVPQPRLKEIMSRSHVLVLPSVEEGLALVQAEAMACGCPVVATTNTGSEDLFEDGVQGFIVPIRSPEAIADRLQRLADDPGLRQRMSAACLERVSAMGGWDRYGDAMTALMKELVEAKREAAVTTSPSGIARSAPV